MNWYIYHKPDLLVVKTKDFQTVGHHQRQPYMGHFGNTGPWVSDMKHDNHRIRRFSLQPIHWYKAKNENTVDGPAKSESPVDGKHPIIVKVSTILLMVQHGIYTARK